MTKPHTPITSRAFRYRNSVETDLRLTFRRERERLKAEAEKAAQSNVTKIKRATK